MFYFQLICLIFIIIGYCIAMYYNIKALIIVSQCRKIMRDIEQIKRNDAKKYEKEYLDNLYEGR